MEYELVCPQCFHGNELRCIENARVERRLGSVTTFVTEFLDLLAVHGDNLRVADVIQDYVEIGVRCERCGFKHIGDDWKHVLAQGEVISLNE